MPLSEDELFTPEQAAVFCAVQGYELWRDRTDPNQPWCVARDEWSFWCWLPHDTLTAKDLQWAMDVSNRNGPGNPESDFWRLIKEGKIVRIHMPPTPQPVKP